MYEHRRSKLDDLQKHLDAPYPFPSGSVPRVTRLGPQFDQGDHPPMKTYGSGRPPYPMPGAAVRSFETGATRSSDAGRYDPEGFLSPLAIERFCEYMNKHRVQPDGSVRDSDNWQKGIPVETYMKGMWRHFLHLWSRHRGYEPTDKNATGNIEEDLCSILFNAQGMLHEILKDKR